MNPLRDLYFRVTSGYHVEMYSEVLCTFRTPTKCILTDMVRIRVKVKVDTDILGAGQWRFYVGARVRAAGHSVRVARLWGHVATTLLL